MLPRAAILGLLIALPLYGQRGDSHDAPGTKQIDPIPLDKIPTSPALAPGEALKTFKLRPGFHIELVAGEPLVHDPIALAFGLDGRLWVVEMSGYMPNVDGIGEDQPVGKIVVLESSGDDGHLDRRVVFADHLVLPRALALVRDGLLVGEPPHLWFYPIVEGNKAGPRSEVARDFGNSRNPQEAPNGLMWGLDNWIYCACHTTRFKNTAEDWQRGPTIQRGEWGISQDDYGRIVYDSNSDQFRIDLVPAEYLARNPNYRYRLGVNVDPVHDETVWPIHITAGVNRGYWKDYLRADGSLVKTTAACAPLIYRGDNFPLEYRGNAFVCEPAGNLVLRDIFVETNGEMTGHKAYPREDFLASTDERFRPTSLYNGPDGALYITDMYRGVLEHRLYVTSYLRRQIKARQLEQPLGLGRFYRVVYGNARPQPQTLAGLTSAQLVEKLASPNGWVQDTAQRLLVERANPGVVPALRREALGADNPVTRVHAAWTLDGMDQIDQPALFALFLDANPKVRAAAIRISERFLKGPGAPTHLSRLISLAQSDADPQVQLQLAFTFGQSTAPLAQEGLAIIAGNAAGRPLVREAILSGLYRRELDFLESTVKNWNEQRPGRGALLDGLAQCVINERNINHIGRLLEIAAAATDWQRAAILEGIINRVPSASHSGGGPKSKIIYFDSKPAGFAALERDETLAGQLGKITRLLTWPGQPGYAPPPPVTPLTAQEQRRYEMGESLFAASCAACHQLTGLGQGGVAPPLADSEWVLGSEPRLARILLQGVEGPIHAAGVGFDSAMPSWASFNDDQLAAILTFIRRAWENSASPVSQEMVATVRATTAKRDGAWTEQELSKMQ
jgi:mono/diheme cytochrome c family protein/glucose/arabinose dehydrogenase